MQWEMNEMRTQVHISIFASRYPVERAVTHQAIRQHFNRVVHLNSAPGSRGATGCRRARHGGAR
jgi:hypothetical protein